jgi:hypothetical protein
VPYRIALTLTVLALLVPDALTSPATATPANTTSTTEVQRSVYARFMPTSTSDWRGTVTADEARVTQGVKQLRRTSSLSFSMWRRMCDLAGCIETVLSASGLAFPAAVFSGDLQHGRIAIDAAPVHVQRYRVTDEELTMLDEDSVTVPVLLTTNKAVERFEQTLTATAPGVTTISRTHQVKATVGLRLDSVRLRSQEGTASQTNILTTMQLPRPSKRR